MCWGRGRRDRARPTGGRPGEPKQREKWRERMGVSQRQRDTGTRTGGRPHTGPSEAEVARVGLAPVSVAEHPEAGPYSCPSLWKPGGRGSGVLYPQGSRALLM